MQAAKADNLRDLRRTVIASRGPSRIITIVNGGNSEIVRQDLNDLAATILRADNAVELLVQVEQARRGQLFGFLDAGYQWRQEGLLCARTGSPDRN